jgi:hypothetical protein
MHVRESPTAVLCLLIAGQLSAVRAPSLYVVVFLQACPALTALACNYSMLLLALRLTVSRVRPHLLLQVQAWLQQRTDAVVMFHPELRHAGFLLDIPWQQQIIKQLLPLLDHKLQQQQQQPPTSGLQAQSDAASSACQRLLNRDKEDQDSSVAGGSFEWQGQGLLQQQPTTPQTHKQQQPGPGSSRATSCSRHSSFELTADAAALPDVKAGTVAGHAAAAAAAPAGADDAASYCDEVDCRSSSGSSMYASMYTETGSMSSSRGSLQMDGVGQQQGTFGTRKAAAAEHGCIAAAAAEPAGSEQQCRSEGGSENIWGGPAAGGSSAGGASSSIGSSSVDGSAYPHQITGQDSKGSVVAAMVLPAHLQLSPSLASGLQADDADAAPNPPGPGLVAPHASLASIRSSRTSNGNSYNTPGCSDLWQGGSLSSPFAAAAASAGAFSRQHQLLQAPLQIQPLESWTGVVASAPASCCGRSHGGSSAASAAAELESPRTFFSGCSSHSWQDLAALAAAREAATAAHILLQPMQALQKLRQMSQRERKPEHQQQQQHVGRRQQQRDELQQQVQHAMQQRQELDVRHVPDAGVSSQQQAVSSKRDSMLRRVEVLLHRRQNRRFEAAARAGGGPSPRSSAAGVFAR